MNIPKMKTILFILFVLNCVIINAQDLTTHQWKNRVLLVISENENSEAFKKQMTLLKDKTKALSDRKLIIYKVLPKRYKLNKESWVASPYLYKKYNSKKETFNVVLIGLDGTIKHQENAAISTKRLFSIIDAMPMRKAEIKRN